MLTMTKTRPLAYPRPKMNPISTMPLFKNISFHDSLEVEKNAVERKYAKGKSIFRQDDRAESVWLVREGFVKKTHCFQDGRSQIISMMGANGIFGVSSFNGGDYGYDCVAQMDATVISFPIQFFNELMEKYPAIAKETISKISILLRRSKDMQIFSQESAGKRILHILLEMAGVFGKIIPLTRREIAEMAGTAPETCIRTCVRLEKVGLIKSGHGQITVVNVEDMMSWMEDMKDPRKKRRP
jgi:CRP/FNR family transcriptional regulator, nitrogen oxide reductase regulator